MRVMPKEQACSSQKFQVAYGELVAVVDMPQSRQPQNSSPIW